MPTQAPPALCCCPQCDQPWPTMTDALKCCNPNWKRMQRVYKSVTGFGIEYGDFEWVEVSPEKAKRKPR
jgi:hypothetical protein